MNSNSCLIIGSGMAGLTAAAALRDRGWAVTVLDKGHNPGGRMATRHLGANAWDHGAQFLTPHDPRFAAQVHRWIRQGWVRPWLREDTAERYCGTHGMNSIARRLAEGCTVCQGVTVARIGPAAAGWRANTAAGETFDAAALILTAPVPQSLRLLQGCAHRLAEPVQRALAHVVYDPCLALLASLDAPGAVPPPGLVRPADSVLDLISDNSQKQVSAAVADLTLHATAAFSREHFYAPAEETAQLMLHAARPWLGGARSAWQLHRWKYARPVTTSPAPCLFTSEPAPVAFAGDAFGGPRIEGAFLSGLAAAEALAAHNK